MKVWALAMLRTMAPTCHPPPSPPDVVETKGTAETRYSFGVSGVLGSARVWYWADIQSLAHGLDIASRQ